MSGNASFSFLDPLFQYSFEESRRRVLQRDQFESYWAQKRIRFQQVLANAEPHFTQFLRELDDLKIEIAPIDILKKVDQGLRPFSKKPSGAELAPALVEMSRTSSSVEVVLDEADGESRLYFRTKQALRLEQAERLIALSSEMRFGRLKELRQRASKPEACPDYFSDGIVCARFFQKFSIGVSLKNWVRTRDLNAFVGKVEKVLEKISPEIERGLEEKLAQREFWIEPDRLISLEVKAGPDFRSLIGKDPSHSIFNPFGPLFDQFGRRSSAEVGFLTVSLLFVSDRDWDESSQMGKNRGSFEIWFTEMVRAFER